MSISTFVENKHAKDALRKFLSTNQQCLLLIGPSGSGKTTLCNLAIDEWGKSYQVLRPVYEDFSTHKEFREHLNKFINMRNMLEIFEKKQKLLFLDDVDTLVTQDRFANSFIQDLITEKKSGLKVLLTCSAGEEKRVSDLKKKMLYERIYNPSVDGAIKYLNDTFRDTIQTKTNADLHKLVKSFNCNIRSCILNIEMLGCTDIETEEVHRITFDKNACDSVQAIFEVDKLTAKDLEVCLSGDPSLLSYIMYDNFCKYLKTPGDTHAITRIIDAYRVGSYLETKLYGRGDNGPGNICNLYRCGILKREVGTIKISDEPIAYTTITTRASNHYNMMKRVGEHLSCNGVSYEALLRYYEIEMTIGKVKSSGVAKRHKEDSALNNYLKRIVDPKRCCERRVCFVRKRNQIISP